MNCELEYRELIKSVKEKYSKNNIIGGYYDKKKNRSFKLEWCEECEEINLWTYWQGKKNLKAEILVVGQDWSSPWKDGKLLKYVSEITSLKNGYSERYIKEINGMSSGTDKNLSELLLCLGEQYCPLKPNNDKLFFTNLCLGYRSEGASRGLLNQCLKDDVVYLEELIKIVEPKLIICLGKDTFDAFINQTGLKIEDTEKSFYKRLSKGTNYVMYNGIPVYGQAHTGTYGVMNRKRFGSSGKNDKRSGLEMMKDDWKIMKNNTNKYLTERYV